MKDILKNDLYRNDILHIFENVNLSLLKRKTILITGGLGLICSSVVDLLIEYNKTFGANIKIYVAARNEKNFSERYGEYPCVEYLCYDAIKPINFDVNADYIIHGAGSASPELYVSMPVETILSNFNGVYNLLEYVKNHNVKRMLYISSSEVYGTKDITDAFEENNFGSVNINNIRSSYSEAKRVSELLCKSYSAEYDIDTVIVRPGHIYGPTASPNDKRISSKFSYLAANEKTLKMKSLGLQKRSYCYSLDCAAAILIALINGKKGESYNIGHNEITSIKEMAQILAEAGNVKLEINEPSKDDLKQFNPMDNSALNNNKIKLLGYKDTFSVNEGLLHTVKILKSIL